VVDRRRRPDVDVAAAWRLGARLIGAAVSLHGPDGELEHRDWLNMHRERQRLRAAWAAVFRDVDVVLCPVTVLPAFGHLQGGLWSDRVVTINGQQRRYVDLEAWPAIVGAAYLPSSAVPVGVTPEGLPVGMQVVAPYLHDRRAIAVGGLLAEACTELGGGYRVPPAAGGTVTVW
jgi:amidase